jgi:hypothetical protein
MIHPGIDPACRHPVPATHWNRPESGVSASPEVTDMANRTRVVVWVAVVAIAVVAVVAAIVLSGGGGGGGPGGGSGGY